MIVLVLGVLANGQLGHAGARPDLGRHRGRRLVQQFAVLRANAVCHQRKMQGGQHVPDAEQRKQGDGRRSAAQPGRRAQEDG
jgi:hypothetical protein